MIEIILGMDWDLIIIKNYTGPKASKDFYDKLSPIIPIILVISV